MAKSKQKQTFDIEGRKMQFNTNSFRELLNNYCKRHKKRKSEVIEQIAECSNVSIEAIKNWQKGYNGPSEMKMIENIANTLNINDVKNLLKEAEKVETMEKLSNRQKDAVKRIYDSIVEYMDDFLNSDGFNTHQSTILENIRRYDNKIVSYFNGIDDYNGYVIREEDNLQTIDKKEELGAMWEILDAAVERKINEIEKTYKKEYFDLRNTDIYNELGDLIYDWDEGIRMCTNEKLEMYYRFSAWEDKVHDDYQGTNYRKTTTTEEDYQAIMNKVNEIINKYVTQE